MKKREDVVFARYFREINFFLLMPDKQFDTEHLSKLFRVSKLTIQNDMENLEKKGIVSKEFGTNRYGLVIHHELNPVLGALRERVEVRKEEKFTLAEYVVNNPREPIIESYDTILINGGSTMEALMHKIMLSSLRQLTIHSISGSILFFLNHSETTSVCLPSGNVKTKRLSLTDSNAIQYIKKLHVPKIFTSLASLHIDISNDKGTKTTDSQEVAPRKMDFTLYSINDEEVVKFDRVLFALGLCQVNEFAKIYVLITPDKIAIDTGSESTKITTLTSNKINDKGVREFSVAPNTLNWEENWQEPNAERIQFITTVPDQKKYRPAYEIFRKLGNKEYSRMKEFIKIINPSTLEEIGTLKEIGIREP